MAKSRTSLILFSLALSFSCVEKKTEKELQTPPPAQEPGPGFKTKAKSETKARQGVWHIVEPGQTLWRICKAYNVDMEIVIQENQIMDPTQISVGQRIFIPGAKELLKVEPAPQLVQSRTDTPKDPLKIEKPEAIPSETRASSGRLLWPVKEGKIFSPFGTRGGQFHEGIDISAPEGTPIYSAEDGKVIYADDRIRGYGNMIVIKHSGNLSTVYAHNRVNLVKEGDFVRRGEKIAEVGRTGIATGAHLHFEVRVGKTAVDPLKYLESAR